MKLYPHILKIGVCAVFLLSFLSTSSLSAQSSNALDFDGSNDWVNCGTDPSIVLNGSTSFTLEAWIYPRSSVGGSGATHNHEIFTTEGGGGTRSGYIFRYGGSLRRLDFVIFYGAGGSGFTQVRSSNNALTLNTWQHVAAVYDGSNMYLYVDGVQVGITANTRALNGSPRPLGIGGGSLNTRHHNGLIDEARVWNDARSQAEIQNFACSVDPSQEPNLVAYYKFDETSGTLLPDLAGSNDGTLQNMDNADWVAGTCAPPCPSDLSLTTTVNGPFTLGGDGTATASAGAGTPPYTYQWSAQGGNSLDFDGNDEYVDCGNDPTITMAGASAFTLEAWLYPTSFPSGVFEATIFRKEGSGNNGYILRYGGSGVIEFVMGSSGWGVATSGSNALTLNTWQHVAAVYDNGALRIYVDGVQVASGTKGGTQTLGTSTSPLGVGGGRLLNFPNGDKRSAFGRIDEARIWNVARTQTELQANSCDIPNPSSESNLMAYYKFGQSTGVSLPDLAGNNNGTLVNMENSDWVSGTCVTNMVTSGQGTASITGPAGTYVLTVTDSNGCTDQVTVTIPAALATTIPTLSQWGLILLGLVVVTIGVVTVWRKKYVITT